MNKYLLIILVLLLTIPIFKDPIFSYFSQDDFFHLRQVMNKGILDIPYFFSPTIDKGYAFYRPFSREMYGFFMFNLFGMSPLPYHLVNLGLIFINSFLILKIVTKLNTNKAIAAFSSIVYLVSAVHSVELYYLSSSQTLFSTFFILCGILLHKKFIDFRKIKYLFLSLTFFILALLSHESAIVYIPLILILEMMAGKKLNRGNLKKVIVFMVPFLIIFLLRATIFLEIKGLPKENVYIPILTIKSFFNSLGWYFLWSFGFPEMLTDFMGSGFSINPNFFKWYGDYAKIIFPLFGYLFFSLIILSFHVKNILFKEKPFRLFSIFYIVSLLPFILFPQHKFVYYLSLPIIWFSLSLGTILGLSWDKGRIYRFFSASFVLIFTILSYQTTQINKITYWAAKRAVAAEVILSDIKKLYPTLDKGVSFYIKDDANYPYISETWGTSSKQAFYIMSGADALQLLYSDSSIKVYYQYLVSSVDKIHDKKIIVHLAKFPY